MEAHPGTVTLTLGLRRLTLGRWRLPAVGSGDPEAVKAHPPPEAVIDSPWSRGGSSWNRGGSPSSSGGSPYITMEAHLRALKAPF
jgi:hypothetical protein